jgi:lysophospholipase L1-like esterase
MKTMTMLFRFCTALFMICISVSCMNSSSPSDKNQITYLPLGDSYTIGTGATKGNTWPEVLTQHLNDSGLVVNMIDNPARNGFTTNDLIQYELPVFFKRKPDFVTLCIGTNDWNTGMDSATFRRQLAYILDTVQATLTNKNNVVVLTVPDFGITPMGAYYANGRNISAGLQSFNNIIAEEANKRKLRTVDIYTVSLAAKNDPTLISDDDLHPSDKGYALWEKAILPVTLSVLREEKQ